MTKNSYSVNIQFGNEQELKNMLFEIPPATNDYIVFEQNTYYVEKVTHVLNSQSYPIVIIRVWPV